MSVLTPCDRPADHIVGGEQSDLAALDAPMVVEAFKSNGLLLFRGFDVDVERFRAFTSRFSAQHVLALGSAKEVTGADVQLIRPLGYKQDLHQENGVAATKPDLLWFFCERPARAGGQTTYADGVEIWKALDESTRRLFESKRIKYSNRVPREHWLDGGYLNVRVHVGRLRMAGSVVRFDAEDAMINEYVTSAVSTTRWGGVPAFANSLRGPYVGLTTTFEDGSPIPTLVLAEIDAVHARLVREIPWQAGDFVMIDNTRYVHGRRPFSDPHRKVFCTMSLANF